MNDRRTAKSKDAIRTCFLSLLKEKKLNKITVAEICRMADIGRGTFYLHYTDVYDLYGQIEDELCQGLYQLFESCYPTTDAENSRRLAEGLTLYVEENKDLFLLLVRSENNRSLAARRFLRKGDYGEPKAPSRSQPGIRSRRGDLRRFRHRRRAGAMAARRYALSPRRHRRDAPCHHVQAQCAA